MPTPSMSALKVFDAAARLGSFKAAAQELAVTPTAVSHQIRALEAQIGQALFVRGTRQVTLTAAGEILVGATAPAFRQIFAALEEIGGGGQTITLTTTPAFAALWLIPRLRGFESACPGFKIAVDTSIQPVDLARDRRIDLAIRYGPQASGPAEDEVQESFCAYASPDYASQVGGRICGELDGQPEASGDVCLLETRWRSGVLPPIGWQDWFAATGRAVPDAAEIRTFDEEQHVVNAALAGQGIALVSDLLVADCVARGWLVPLLTDVRLPGFGYSLIAPPERRDTRKIRAFISWYHKELASAPAV